jgi:Flp pilus assembly pilin Flp
MSVRDLLSRAGLRLRRFRREEDGANLVEFSLVVLLFLFLLFAIIDFGRLANAWVGANKATHIAARIAAVRPPVCPGVPAVNGRGSLTTPNFGTLCRFADNTCADPGDFICPGVAGNPTADEIYAAVLPLLPPGTQIGDLRFAYTHDPNLGFLGGPYVPMVTVDLNGVDFVFVSQLGQFVRYLTGNSSNLGNNIAIPGMSVSLPGEDLALGTGG